MRNCIICTLFVILRWLNVREWHMGICIQSFTQIEHFGMLDIVNVKLKEKLPLCLIKHHAMKTWVSGGIAPRILKMGTKWRWAVIFTARPFCPGEGASDTHSTGGLLDPRFGLDSAVAERKCPCPYRKSNPVRPARSLVSILTELPRHLPWRSPVFLNRRALSQWSITNLNVILYLSTCHTVYISVLIIFMIMP
jgi:hypothetical protein